MVWYLLQKLCDVFAAALGPGPGVGVVVQGGGHDVVLGLHAGLSTLWVVIVRHVKPGEEKNTRTHTHRQNDYELSNIVVGTIGVNVKRCNPTTRHTPS